MTLLETQGLNKRFNGINAVDDFSLAVEKGTITSLIGPNGAGKTTVFNLITRLIHSDSGKILFKERLLNTCPPYYIHRLGIGRTFQLIRLFWGFTVLENLLIAIPQREDNFLYALLRRKNTRKELVDSCVELLKTMRLADKKDVPANELSYGQQKLVEISRALITNPEFLLLDEPVSGIAPKMRDQITEILFNLKEQGKTILLIEHNIKFVLEVSDNVIVMNHGKKIASGKPEEVKNNQGVIKAYLGDLITNA